MKETMLGETFIVYLAHMNVWPIMLSNLEEKIMFFYENGT